MCLRIVKKIPLDSLVGQGLRVSAHQGTYSNDEMA